MQYIIYVTVVCTELKKHLPKWPILVLALCFTYFHLPLKPHEVRPSTCTRSTCTARISVSLRSLA